jgi:hypothetical protein
MQGKIDNNPEDEKSECRQKERSLTQHSESTGCKVTKGNRLLNLTRKAPATRSDDFYGKIKCNEV